MFICLTCVHIYVAQFSVFFGNAKTLWNQETKDRKNEMAKSPKG